MSRRALAFSAGATLLMGLCTFTASTRWADAHSIARGDGLAYFLYARSMVVDFDTDLTPELEGIGTHFNASATTGVEKTRRRVAATGRLVLPWPVGCGVVMAPFYAVGWGVENVMARLEGRPPDSYGLIPQFSFGLGSLAFALLGCWCTFACCRSVAPKEAAGLAILAVSLAGPLVYYTFIQPAMAHAPSFGLLGLLLLLWWRMWHGGSVTLRRFGLLCLVFGFLVTIRYQNVLFGTLPLVLFLRHLRNAGPREGARLVAVGLAALALPASAQVMHYAAMHGSFADLVVKSSSGFEAEQNAVDLGSPHFFDVLFSCQHGAFYWSPVFGLSAAGLAWASFDRGWARVFLVTFIAHVYVLGGLQGAQNWSGGHAFGMRYLTECGALLAVGLATVLGALGTGPRRVLGVAALGTLVAWNVGLMGAFTFKQIPTLECVTLGEMARGVARLLSGLPPLERP